MTPAKTKIPLLSTGRTSRLYRSLVRDRKIAVFTNTFSPFPGDKYPSLWLVFSMTAPGHSNEEVQAAVRAELERLKSEQISDEEMRRFRTRAKADLLRRIRDNLVQHATRSLPSTRILGILASFLVGISIASQTAAQIDEPERLVYPAMPTVAVPLPERFELDNGMVVMLLEDHELPLVEARALIRTGSRWEPAEKIGLASLVGQVLRSGGIEGVPGDQLDDLLEGRGAILESSIDVTTGTVFMSFLEGDLAELLEIFADVLRRPAFEEEKLEVAKTQEASAIARQNDEATGIVRRELRELISLCPQPDLRLHRQPPARRSGGLARQILPPRPRHPRPGGGLRQRRGAWAPQQGLR